MDDDDLVKSLKGIYQHYPSTRLMGNLDQLKQAADGHPEWLGALDKIERDKALFMRVRSKALVDLPVSNPTTVAQPVAFVSGLSVGGMVAAAMLVKAGYYVCAFEKRKSYTRNLQWAARQAVVDQLATIDPQLARDYLENVASAIPRGSVRIRETERRWEVRPRQQPSPASDIDITRIPPSAEQMLPEKSCTLVECRAFEEMMLKYLRQLEHQGLMEIHLGACFDLGQPDPKGRFPVISIRRLPLSGDPDPKDKSLKPLLLRNDNNAPRLIIIAEGSGSSTRTQIGISPVPTSPPRLQIAGVVEYGAGGVMAKHHRLETGRNGSPETLFTGTMSRQGRNRTWVVGDISSQHQDMWHLAGLDPTTSDYAQLSSTMRPGIELEFRRISGPSVIFSEGGVKIDYQGRSEYTEYVDVLPTSPDITCGMNSMNITGAIDGRPPKLFLLQQRICPRAVAGSNVICLGDAVGNGHWAVGGGMQIAVISHGERLKKLLLDIDLGMPDTEAIANYDAAVVEDSLAWGKLGITAFYPDLPPATVKEAYTKAIHDWRMGRVTTPLESLETRLKSLEQRLESVH